MHRGDLLRAENALLVVLARARPAEDEGELVARWRTLLRAARLHAKSRDEASRRYALRCARDAVSPLPVEQIGDGLALRIQGGARLFAVPSRHGADAEK
jgi:hypothetical protein